MTKSLQNFTYYTFVYKFIRRKGPCKANSIPCDNIKYAIKNGQNLNWKWIISGLKVTLSFTFVILFFRISIDIFETKLCWCKLIFFFNLSYFFLLSIFRQFYYYPQFVFILSFFFWLLFIFGLKPQPEIWCMVGIWYYGGMWYKLMVGVRYHETNLATSLRIKAKTLNRLRKRERKTTPAAASAMAQKSDVYKQSHTWWYNWCCRPSKPMSSNQQKKITSHLS